LLVLIGLALAAILGCSQPQQQSSRVTSAHALQPIRYTRTGGFAGTDDRLIISPDGTAVATGPLWGNRSGRLTPEQIAALAAAFDGWDKVRGHYPAVPGVTDPFDLSLTYGGKMVTATDVSDGFPDTFQRAQGLLDQIVHELPATVTRPATTLIPATTRTVDDLGMPARAR
jgi:hypothetical protein